MMQLTVYNNNIATSGSVTIQGQTIAYSDTYVIPTADLLTWAGDLTFWTYVTDNVVLMQDDLGTFIPNTTFLFLLSALANGKVSTS